MSTTLVMFRLVGTHASAVSCPARGREGGTSVASFRDLLAQVKREIHEVEPSTAEQSLGKAVFLDVREPDEYEQGAIPGAVHLPRGMLEVQVEGRLTDKDAEVVVYCAGGTRSAFAAKSLEELGYTDVVSMTGGFNRWKDENRSWTKPAVLTNDQRNRYARHLLLPEVGEKGQQKLLESKVLILGAGGLGSPTAMYLAAAGVGTIGIVDMDVVDASNLQRQILHNMDRIGDRKVDSAKKTLTSMNPDVNVVTYDTRLGADNVVDLFTGYDLIVDGTDNFPTRYLVNDASLLTKVPVVHGSIFRFEGQVTVFNPYVGPCYRCIVPEPPPPELAPSCSEAGVLGVLCGIIGSLESVEAVKMLLGIGNPLVGRLLAYDALEEEFRTFKVRRDPECPACGENADIVIAEYDQLCMPHVRKPAA
jgi:molybdopterin/thiamine biosynthesis adenylyltransferase/rhodanese-related sulfurtransferase